MTTHRPAIINVPCCAPRAFAYVAPSPECVWIGEREAPATRTVLVLGVRVEVAVQR